MKKRRPFSVRHSHSPKNSPRALRAQSILIKSKSHHELKRHRHQRGSVKQKSFDHVDNISIKKEVFDSLESLFDLKKPLTLPEIQHSSVLNYYLETERFINWTSKCSSPRSPHLALPSFLNNFTNTSKLEPHIFIQSNELALKENARKTEDLDEIVKDEEIFLLESYESSKNSCAVNSNFWRKMADDKKSEFSESVAPEKLTEDVEKLEASKAALNPEEVELSEVVKNAEEKNASEKDEIVDLEEFEALPPRHPLPPNMGEGIPIKPGANRDSIMSAVPLTDSAVMKEMNDAYQRCMTIGEEIELLKKEMNELIDKSDLSQDDTILLSEKQENVNSKLAQLDEITRKIQRLIGLSDPSSYTFATMFGMLPYPHQNKPEDVTSSEGEKLIEEYFENGEENELTVDHLEDDEFDVPKLEYPEDKLPRVIICGNSEDCIPKIVVADSKRRRPATTTTHLESLTGKLSESLIMQEKLVKENAKLEGGKYRLEEAVLEKDNAVDNLQRKVCGLQAEMRIIVKENTELSRQLACLNQKIVTPSCCYSCPGGSPSSPLSTPTLPTYSYNSWTRLDDSSGLQDNVGDSLDLTSGNPVSCKCRTVPATPRLAGGGVEENPLLLEKNISRGNMSCVSPTGTKASNSPRPQSRGICPTELENIYGKNTKHLEEQLGNIESEVRKMQSELMNVQRERNQLDQQRKLFKCTGPCAPCPCNPTSGTAAEPIPRTYQSSNTCPPCAPSPQTGVNTLIPIIKMNLPQQASQGSCLNGLTSGSQCSQQQLRDLKEQYARLQDDYKSKLCEVSCLRSDAEKMKQETRDIKEEKAKMENKLIDLQERLKVLEIEKNKMNGNKEQLIEQEQALLVAKQRFRDAQDELEELRSFTQDQSAQLEDYRNKYLMAQQKVEEQQHQLDLMELDNARMNENVTLEIGRVKNQFQEKLAELAPLPDILKQTQLKLQESQQLRQIAERNCEDLSRELLDYKDKIQAIQKEMDILRSENIALQGDCGQGSGKCEELERKNSELRTENDRLKNTLIRIEEQEAQLQKRVDEKLHEVAQLTSLLEQVREDSARQVSRTKERCEMVRKTMQGQISEMEKQLAQCRATARTVQKERDEIRQKMQGQINNLNEAFEHAQGRIRSLQGHVNYLKTSYSNIFNGQGQGEAPVPLIPGESPTPGQGYDSCDCNY